jgi:hypothetical protein
MFELEFDIKMKAQLKYLETKEKQKQRKGFLSAIRHEYLWTPTTTFYIGSCILFLIVRNKFGLQPFHIIPFMMIPVTADYCKREFFVQQVAQKDRQQLAERRNVVQKIINEKK